MSPEQEMLIKANALHFVMEDEKEDQGCTDAQTHYELSAHLTSKAVHISTNMWPRKREGKDLKKQATRSMMHGVEIRILPESHFLAGETGLFASVPFAQFSIVGEYCGQVMRPNSYGGEYVAELERTKGSLHAMSLDAQKYGNEARSINHYQNIATEPNAIMQVCYVDELPRIMIVCKKDIAIGEEILLDYGKGYVEEFLGEKKEQKAAAVSVKWNEMAGEAAGDY